MYALEIFERICDAFASWRFWLCLLFAMLAAAICYLGLPASIPPLFYAIPLGAIGAIAGLTWNRSHLTKP